MCRPEERRDFGVCDYVIANPKDGFLQLADSEDFTHLVTRTNKFQLAAVCCQLLPGDNQSRNESGSAAVGLLEVDNQPLWLNVFDNMVQLILSFLCARTPPVPQTQLTIGYGEILQARHSFSERFSRVCQNRCHPLAEALATI